MKKRMLYPMLGTALGAGAIIGSMLVRYFTTNLHPSVSHFMTYEVVAHFYFYVYMGGGTTVVLMFSGFFIGKLQDGLIDKNRQLDLANQDLNELLHLHAESEEKYRQAIDQASDAILFVEIETAQILDANAKATELTGYSHVQLCQRKIWDLYLQEDIEKAQRLFNRTKATGEIGREDLRFIHQDGKQIDIEVSANIISYNKNPAGGGKPFGWEDRPHANPAHSAYKVIQQICRDVRERKFLERQLRHADKLASIGRFASGIAHEVGNPLGSISAYAQILLMGGESETERREYLQAINSESKRIGELLKHLLDFSRPTADNIEWVDVNCVIDQALKLVSAQERFKAIQLTKQLDTPSPQVRIVSDQLKQVLINLFLNAADAMPDGGRLTVKSDTDSQFVFISVTDTGTGIKPEDRERLFDPFFTTKPEGIGLGLVISARLVEKYGGVIEVHSDEEVGSTFTVLLPLSLEALGIDASHIEIKPEDQSIWSIEYPNVRNLKALPLSGSTEGDYENNS